MCVNLITSPIIKTKISSIQINIKTHICNHMVKNLINKTNINIIISSKYMIYFETLLNMKFNKIKRKFLIN